MIRPGLRFAEDFEEAFTSADATCSAEAASLVAFAEALCVSAAAEPSSTFSADLRAHLMVGTIAVPQPPVSAARRIAEDARRRTATLGMAAVSALGILTVSATSAAALPGEVLYPVKRGTETVQLALRFTDASRGGYQLGMASERLDEVSGLANEQKLASTMVTATFSDFNAQATNGASELLRAYAETGDVEPIRTVADFAATANAQVVDLRSMLPVSLQDELDGAAQTISAIAADALKACPDCTSMDGLIALANVESVAPFPPSVEPAAESQEISLEDLLGLTDRLVVPPESTSNPPSTEGDDEGESDDSSRSVAAQHEDDGLQKPGPQKPDAEPNDPPRDDHEDDDSDHEDNDSDSDNGGGNDSDHSDNDDHSDKGGGNDSDHSDNGKHKGSDKGK